MRIHPLLVHCAAGMFSCGAVLAQQSTDRAYSAVGSAMAQNLRLGDLQLSEAELAAFLEGMRAAARGQPYLLDEAGVQLMEQLQRRLIPPADDGRVQRWLVEAKHHYQLQQSSSGLLYRMQGGQGPRPRREDTVVISYQTRAPDGQTPLASLSRQSVRTNVGDLMPGMAEALIMMPLGAEAQLVIPPDLSFSDGAWPEDVERGAPLVMIMRLENIIPRD